MPLHTACWGLVNGVASSPPAAPRSLTPLSCPRCRRPPALGHCPGRAGGADGRCGGHGGAGLQRRWVGAGRARNPHLAPECGPSTGSPPSLLPRPHPAGCEFGGYPQARLAKHTPPCRTVIERSAWLLDLAVAYSPDEPYAPAVAAAARRAVLVHNHSGNALRPGLVRFAERWMPEAAAAAAAAAEKAGGARRAGLARGASTGDAGGWRAPACGVRAGGVCVCVCLFGGACDLFSGGGGGACDLFSAGGGGGRGM
jgi:hypothetical protein